MTLIEVTRFGKTFQIDHNLKTNLDYCLLNTKAKNDNVLMIDGREGSGKSKGMAFPIAYYLSGENIKVVFTSEQFNKAYTEAKEGDTVIFDEFVTVGMSLQAMNKEQQNIIQMMTMSRKRLVNIILVVPNYFMFGWYFTTHRSLALINVYTKNLMERGYFRFYNRDKMAKMWFYGKKTFRTHIDKMADFHGRFPYYPDGFFFPEDEYQKAKDEAIKSIGLNKDTGKLKTVDKIALGLAEIIHKKFKVKNKIVAQQLGMTESFYTKEMTMIRKKLKNEDLFTTSTETNYNNTNDVSQYCEKEAVQTNISFNLDKQDTGDNIYSLDVRSK